MNPGPLAPQATQINYRPNLIAFSARTCAVDFAFRVVSGGDTKGSLIRTIPPHPNSPDDSALAALELPDVLRLPFQAWVPANAIGQFGVVQREERREAFPAPGDKPRHPRICRLDPRKCVSSQCGDQLAANPGWSCRHVVDGHRAPVSAVDRSVDNERHPKPVALKVACGEQLVRVVKIPAGTPGQQSGTRNM